MKMNNKLFLKRLLSCSLMLLSTFYFGCSAKMVIVPNIEQVNNVKEYKLKGKIVYDGNKEYLPRSLGEDLSAEPLLAFKYNYTVTNGVDNYTPINLFNPLLIIGFPIGESTLAVTGKLEIFKKNDFVKSYTSTCGFEVNRNLFSAGETFTDLRLQGLIAVRNNIEAQIYSDRELFVK